MKKIVYLIPILIILVTLAIIIIAITTKNKEQTDAIKFKNEYEELNTADENGKTYQELEIPEKNPIKYADINDIIELFDKKQTAVIYIGYPTCPWCRKAIPILLEAADQTNTKEILYLNITKYNNKFAIIDEKVTKIQEEQEGYYDLLNLLDEVTKEYIINDNGNQYPVNEKRIYSPTVLKVEKGQIKAYKSSVSGLSEEDYQTQKKELKKEYINIMK